jgi:hypothetical protein
MTIPRELRQALSHVAATSRQAHGFDATVRERLTVARRAGMPFDWEMLAPIVEDLLRAVQEELDADERCKERKHFHRAWVRGFVTACAEGGLKGESALTPLAHLTLLTSYDEGIMLRVFASSLGYGVGQAWADLSGDEGERKLWLEALKKGIREGLATLLAEWPEGDPELMAPEKTIVAAMERGLATGAFLRKFSPLRGAR